MDSIGNSSPCGVWGGGHIGGLIKYTTGLKYNLLSIQTFLGQRVCLSQDWDPSRIHGFLFAPSTGSGGRVKKVHGALFLQNNKAVFCSFLAKKIGDVVRPYPKGAESMGVVGIHCHSLE